MKKLENKKDEIGRKDLKSNDLKRLVIRLDYIGVFDPASGKAAYSPL